MPTKPATTSPALEAAHELGRLLAAQTALRDHTPLTPDRRTAMDTLQRDIDAARLTLRRAVNDPTAPTE